MALKTSAATGAPPPGFPRPVAAGEVRGRDPELSRSCPADVRWKDEIIPALTAVGRRIVPPKDLSTAQRDAARRHFVASVFPALTPVAIDPGHPFPRVPSGSLNLAVALGRPAGRRARRGAHLAVVHLPPTLPRLIRLPCESGEAYALLEEVVAVSAGELFAGNAIGETAVFSLTRASDLPIDGGEACLASLRAGSRRHDSDPAIRLEISASASRELETALAAALNLEWREVYRIAAPLRIADLVELASLPGTPARLPGSAAPCPPAP